MYDSEIFPASAKTQHDKVLYLLRQAGKHGVTCSDFLQTSLADEFRARISELRNQGFKIVCEIHRGGKSIYRLIETKIENGQYIFV